jgi:hypothetical protein
MSRIYYSTNTGILRYNFNLSKPSSGKRGTPKCCSQKSEHPTFRISAKSSARSGFSVGKRCGAPEPRKSQLAERGGFEPPRPVRVYSLSRRALSTTQPSLHTYDTTKNNYTTPPFRSLSDSPQAESESEGGRPLSHLSVSRVSLTITPTCSKSFL